MGKVTVGGKIIYEGSATPKFLGGVETGVTLTPPDDEFAKMKKKGKSSIVPRGIQEINLTFAGDYIKYTTDKSSSEVTVLASTFAPDGVIYVEGALVRVKGVVKGQYLIVSGGMAKGSGKGCVYIDDDITYYKDPRVYPSSEDILGIVAMYDVMVTDNTPNHSDVNIHASIYCQEGGFGAENPGTRPNSGQINIFGGIQQKHRKLVSNPWPRHGFLKNYRYDDRLLDMFPPSYPGTGGLEVISWKE